MSQKFNGHVSGKSLVRAKDMVYNKKKAHKTNTGCFLGLLICTVHTSHICVYARIVQSFKHVCIYDSLVGTIFFK